MTANENKFFFSFSYFLFNYKILLKAQTKLLFIVFTKQNLSIIIRRLVKVQLMSDKFYQIHAGQYLNLS